MASADTAILSGNSVIAKYSGAAWIQDAINQKVRTALILYFIYFLEKLHLRYVQLQQGLFPFMTKQLSKIFKYLI